MRFLRTYVLFNMCPVELSFCRSHLQVFVKLIKPHGSKRGQHDQGAGQLTYTEYALHRSQPVHCAFVPTEAGH